MALARCRIEADQGGTPHARARVSLVSWKGRSHALLFMVPLGLPSARPMVQALRLPFEYYIFYFIFIFYGRRNTPLPPHPLTHLSDLRSTPPPFSQSCSSTALSVGSPSPYVATQNTASEFSISDPSLHRSSCVHTVDSKRMFTKSF